MNGEPSFIATDAIATDLTLTRIGGSRSVTSCDTEL